MCLIASKRTGQKKSRIALHVAFSILDGFVVVSNIVLLVRAFFFLLRMLRFFLSHLICFGIPSWQNYYIKINLNIIVTLDSYILHFILFILQFDSYILHWVDALFALLEGSRLSQKKTSNKFHSKIFILWQSSNLQQISRGREL